MDETVYIVNEMASVVAKVNIALSASGFSRPVSYMYGHPMEISQRLQELTGTKLESNKFPVIILFTDIKIRRNTPVGWYGSTSLRMLIANNTQANYISTQRTEYNFIPILHPIKRALISQIGLHKPFSVGDEFPFTETDMYFYGSQINNKNIFNDRIDAIELTDLNVLIDKKNCSKSNSLK